MVPDAGPVARIDLHESLWAASHHMLTATIAPAPEVAGTDEERGFGVAAGSRVGRHDTLMGSSRRRPACRATAVVVWRRTSVAMTPFP